MINNVIYSSIQKLTTVPNKDELPLNNKSRYEQKVVDILAAFLLNIKRSYEWKRSCELCNHLVQQLGMPSTASHTFQKEKYKSKSVSLMVCK